MDEDLTIETERIILRQWRLEDVDDLVEGLNNLNVTKWLAQVTYPYTEEDAKNFINKSIENKLYNFAIVLKEENKVIGGTQLSNISFVIVFLDIIFVSIHVIYICSKKLEENILCSL